jgi:hypothetical protein
MLVTSDGRWLHHIEEMDIAFFHSRFKSGYEGHKVQL